MDRTTDFSGALIKVKGYRFGFLKLLGILFVFFSALAFGIVYGEMHAPTKAVILTGVVCGLIAAPSIGLIVYEYIANSRLKNQDCVILFEDGITVFADNPKAEKGYKYFSFDEIADYGFINIIRKNNSGETRLVFREKRRSSDTYLYADLMNYGYMRITTKDDGYYNIPVGDIQTVRDFLKKHTQIEEFIYIRIAGIHDVIIKLD